MEKFKIEFKWASIFTGLSLIWVYAEKLFGLHDEHIAYHTIVGLVILIPLFVCIYFCIKERKESVFNGVITWQKAFLSGTVLSLLIAGLSIGTTYVMTQYISPEFFDNAISKSISSGANEELVQGFFSLNSYIMEGIFFYLAWGIMISVVYALIERKKEKNVVDKK